MTPKSAFISLIFAAASIALVLLVSKPTAPNENDGSSESSLSFELPKLSKVHVSSNGLTCEMSPWITRDVWVSDMDGVRWPVAASRVRAAAERVEQSIQIGVREIRTEELPSALALRFECDGGARTLEISPGMQARDRIRVRVGDGEASDVLTESSISDMFSPESLRMWREATVLIAVRGKEREFIASSGAMSAKLSRGPKGWTLINPVLAAANDAAVNMQLGKLRSMRARKILPETAVPAAMFDSPIARFEAVTELPDGAGELRESVVFGNAADLANQTVYARVQAETHKSGDVDQSASAWGPAVLIVDRADVEQLTADPRVYVSNRATSVVKADVLAVVVRAGDSNERRFERTASGWDRDSQKLESLVRVLCDTDATFTHIDSAEVVGDVIAEVALHSSRGPLDRFVVYFAKNAPATHVVVESGGLRREFPIDAEMCEWLKRR